MQDKRLCLVIPSLQAGGMERVMSELAGYFSLKGELELHLVLYDATREIFYSIPERIILHEPEFSFNNNWRLLNTLRTSHYLRKTIKHIKPDSILSFGEYWNSLVLISLLGLSFPIYISDRCSPEKQFSRFHTFLRKLLYPRATGIIAQTAKAKEMYFRQFGHHNIQVIGNPIRRITGVREEDRENIVLMVGRLIRTKHQDKLIELFLDLDIPDWKLILVGYDHLKQNNFERLQAIIDKKNAMGQVMLVGRQIDVDSFYRRSKIFAFTSSSEGFPNAIGEAMSAGLPAVAFDCVAGPAEMITDNHNGFLVPLFDFEQFQGKLERLMKDENIRTTLGRNASDAINRFSIPSIGEKYLQFILRNQQH